MFINAVQEALGKRQRAPDSPYSTLQESLSQIEEKATAVRERTRENVRNSMEKLAEVAKLRGWNVYRASSPESALDCICHLASSSGAKLVMRSEQEVFVDVPVDGPLSDMGIQVTVMARTSGLSPEVLRQQAAEAGIGITGVDYAVAETGSVVVLPREGLSRLVSLLPPIHVALVRPQEVVESLEDLFILRRLAYHQGGGDMGSYMNLITGPSRTADIEQTLVVGVHGPKEAHLILLE